MQSSDSRFLALLRGINVGGKNIILKDDLRRFFEDLGFSNVRTYIQSGNILFRSPEKDPEALTTLIEQGLSDRFSYDARATVRSYDQYQKTVASAPADWGSDPLQRHNALFTLDTITPQEFVAQLPPPKQEIETITTGPNVVFWSVSKEKRTRTTLVKLPSLPVYQEVTIRNHNTTLRLLELFDEI